MDMTRDQAGSRLPQARAPLSSTAAVALAIAFGLVAGYLDVCIIVLSKYCWHADGYFGIARDFPWTVPAAHVVLLMVPAALVAALNMRRRKVSLRAASWLFASLAIWAALLRAPLYGWCTALLALGSGRLIADAVAARWLKRRQIGLALVGLLGVW